MNEKFVEAIDAALPIVGYRNRSSFIRDAMTEKLRADRKSLTRRHNGVKRK